MDTPRIDEIARRLMERVPPALRSVQADLESNFKAVLRERLSKLDLVSRDEFDAQARCSSARAHSSRRSRRGWPPSRAARRRPRQAGGG